MSGNTYAPAASSGPHWRSWAPLGAAGHRGTVVEVEPGLYGITIEPSVGIGQRALLVRTPAGNLLWDPNGYLDDDLVATLRQLGGVAVQSLPIPAQARMEPNRHRVDSAGESGHMRASTWHAAQFACK